MRIGIDIDGVVSDSFAAWLEKMNLHFGKEISVVTDYEIHLLYDVPWQDMNHFFITERETLFMIPEPVRGSREGIESFLAAGHEITYITARLPEEEELTRKWMTKHNIPHQDILFTGFQCKADLAKQRKLDVFIEDYLLNAKRIAEQGINVLLLNTTYNHGEAGGLITRCQDWQEIRGEITRFARG